MSFDADLDRTLAAVASVREGLITETEARQLLRTERAAAAARVAADPSSAVDLQAAIDYLYGIEVTA